MREPAEKVGESGELPRRVVEAEEAAPRQVRAGKAGESEVVTADEAARVRGWPGLLGEAGTGY